MESPITIKGFSIATTPVRRKQGITQLRKHDPFATSRATPSTRPWQALAGETLTLEAGWYCLTADRPAVVELRDAAAHRLVELPAEPGCPAHVRLDAGTWATRLFAAARPGTAWPEVSLAAMGVADRATLFGGRAAQALKRGVSPAQLAGLVVRALKPEGTFGVRAAGEGDALGLLTRADREAAWERPARLEARLAAFAPGPRFLAGDEAQLYANRTGDETDDWDWRLVTSPGERLTPDALLLFAEAVEDRPGADVILGDRWEGDRVTQRVAFDPLLYACGLPTPRVERRGAVMEGPWVAQMPRFQLLGVPVAEIAQPPAPPRPLVLLAPARDPATIIIPTRDKAGVLKTCLDALKATRWPHQIVIVDNGSAEAETFALFDEARSAGATVLRDDAPFNFSRLSNRGAAASAGRWLVFMNNDVEVLDGEWLERMVACAALPEAGAVGARLLYDDGSLQHGGVATGLTELCGHPWRHLPPEDIGRVDRLARTSLRSAVTGALLCVAREAFEAAGGFDETAFPVTLNDVDLCLKLMAAGRFNIYCADAVARHPEGVSRGRDSDPVRLARRRAELDAFAAKWPCGPDADAWLAPSVMRSSERIVLK